MRNNILELKTQGCILAVFFPSVICLWACVSTAQESNRDSWRGFRNGGTSASVSKLPTRWSPSSGVAWQRELKGYGQSVPIIHRGRVFVTSVDGPMKDSCIVECLDLESGASLWSFQFDAANRSPSNFMASRAAPTPVVDDHGAYAFFETGDCIALDLSGKKLWRRELTTEYGKFDNNHGLGCSPTQTDELVLLNIEHKGPSYLIALNKRNGQTVWKVDRPSSSSWSSPIVTRCAGQECIVVSSAGAVTGYAAATGQQLWNIDSLSGNSVPSPTVLGSRLFVGARTPEFGSDGEAARSNLCIELSTQTGGVPTIAWRAAKAVSDYASPVVSDNCVYFLNKVGVVHCLDAKSGTSNYVSRLGTQCWATPIVAGNLVYFFGKDGRTQVIKSGPTFEIFASNDLWDLTKPPKPEHYVEYTGDGAGHDHGVGRRQKSASDSNDRRNSSEDSKTNGKKRLAGGGMLSALLGNDANGDGVLDKHEIPTEFKTSMELIDLDKDGVLSQVEIKAMADSFAARRADSRETSRDPIVYGAAAADRSIVIRTGTRVYCVRE